MIVSLKGLNEILLKIRENQNRRKNSLDEQPSRNCEECYDSVYYMLNNYKNIYSGIQCLTSETVMVTLSKTDVSLIDDYMRYILLD